MRGTSRRTWTIALAVLVAVAGVAVADHLDGGEYKSGDVTGAGDAAPEHTFDPPSGYEAFGRNMDVNGSQAGESVIVQSKENATVYTYNSLDGTWSRQRIFEGFAPANAGDDPGVEGLALTSYEKYRGEAVALDYEGSDASNHAAFRTYYGWLPHAVAVYRQHVDPTGTVSDWDHVVTKVFDTTVQSVAVAGHTLAVGLPEADGGQGAVYIADFGAGCVSGDICNEKRVTNAEGDGEALGIDVAAQGVFVLAGDPTGTWGAKTDDDGYAAVIDSTLGSVVTVLDPDTGGHQFGQSVDLSATEETLAMVGAPTGWRAYRCADIDTTATCTEYTAEEYDDGIRDENDPVAFGAVVEVWDGSSAISAPKAEVAGTERGKVFIFEDGIQATNKTNPSDTPVGADFGRGMAWNGYGLWAGDTNEYTDGEQTGKTWFWD